MSENEKITETTVEFSRSPQKTFHLWIKCRVMRAMCQELIFVGAMKYRPTIIVPVLFYNPIATYAVAKKPMQYAMSLKTDPLIFFTFLLELQNFKRRKGLCDFLNSPK